jgi:phytol kinase
MLFAMSPFSLPVVPRLPLYLTMPAVLAALLGIMLTLRLYQRRYHPHPEITRKILHVGMGLIVQTFPWLFPTPWPVIALASAAIALLLAIRLLPVLRSLGAVTAVSRVSLGDVYFPLSVATLFTLTHNEPLLYCVPLLILALADAVAALIGLVYGRLHYEAAEGNKTVEGSLAFFIVAFLSAHIPLLLLTNTGRAETLLIALILGLIVMLAEAIAWRGLDNVFIPLLSFFLLRIYLTLSARDLCIRLLVTAILFLLVFLFRRRTTLTHSALLGAVLFGYATWTLADWLWLLPPLTLFLLHLLVWPRSTCNADRQDIHAVISTAAPGLFWLFLYAHYAQPLLLFPFTTLFSAHVALIAVSWIAPTAWSRRKLLLVLRAILAGAALSLLPLVALLLAPSFGLPTPPRLSQHLATFLAANLLGVALAAVVFACTLPHLIDRPTQRYVHVHHMGGFCATLAAGVSFAILQCYS